MSFFLGTLKYMSFWLLLLFPILFALGKKILWDSIYEKKKYNSFFLILVWCLTKVLVHGDWVSTEYDHGMGLE
jgi:hypothetical protein